MNLMKLLAKKLFYLFNYVMLALVEHIGKRAHQLREFVNQNLHSYELKGKDDRSKRPLWWIEGI